MSAKKKLEVAIAVALLIGYLALLFHETATGGGYIRGVAVKLVAEYGMKPLAAHNSAAAIVVVAPLVAFAGILGFMKKEGE